jgi:hypothetical protein
LPHANVRLAARVSQFHLALALAIAAFLLVGRAAVAAGTTHAQLEQGRLTVFVADRIAARAAQQQLAGLQAMAE